MLQGEHAVSLSPRMPLIRRYQHEMAQKANLVSRSTGRSLTETCRSCARTDQDSAPITHGCFITFEGPDGRQVHARGPLAAWLVARGIEPVVTREPGGTRIGEQIQCTTNPDHTEMTAETEILLYPPRGRSTSARSSFRP